MWRERKLQEGQTCRSSAETEFSLEALGDRFEQWFMKILDFCYIFEFMSHIFGSDIGFCTDKKI
ncbi:MAG: hypothetical protein KME49_24260 [Brasilonema octagenarum HA4186-MV1]|jgi:hypothetical protein|uniref:Uncharacterized protein n=2 Tax=Brasilonema TaxID=383614 RepID=A0A856M6W2_9CYAN|nr:hypothetical protein [Brasilonema sennae]MBW4628541.1 hypothetical protein [Brasilonema octagenarum HA4186-MV1]NMF67197.1 hypothetical protein [Brasilonema octagenarum UFV-OR1]QDL06903.1 hypothetical protein DP114_02370 [Brasilonema sennae CENA114]QDL13267.1 hypothetical protein DP113_02330 [Brasilonema octagenarum UFV-E1]